MNTKVNAGFFTRLAAFLIDVFITALMCTGIEFIGGLIRLFWADSVLNTHILFSFTVFDIVAYLITVMYFTLFTYYEGATLGKKAMRIRVEAKEGELTFFNCLYRETIGRYLSSLLCIGYLLVAVDKEHRALHDRLCDTEVVYEYERERTGGCTDGIQSDNAGYQNQGVCS